MLRSRRQAPRSSISRARVGTGRNVPLGAARPGYRRGTLGGSTKANLLYGSGEREHPEIPVGGVWGLAGCGMVREGRPRGLHHGAGSAVLKIAVSHPNPAA